MGINPYNPPGSFSPTFANFPNLYYVDSSSTVSGTRDGSFYRPFLTVADAIDAIGEPVDSDDYLRTIKIEVLNEASYSDPLTIPTRKLIFSLNGADLTGGITIEIDSAQRFGSTSAPTYIFQGRLGSFNSQLTGGFNVQLATGGTAVSSITLGFINNFIIGNIVCADGVNGTGGAVVTNNISCTFESTFHLSQILARDMDVTFSNSEIRSVVSHEFRNVNGINNSNLRALEIYEYGTATTQRDVTGLTLNSAGGVTWDLVNSDDNWTVDALSASEIITKIDSQPNGTINLTKVTAEAIGIVDAGGYYTATEVEGALQEIGDGTALDGSYIRLDGTNTPTTGEITFGERTYFDARLRLNEDLEISNGFGLRAQPSPGGSYQRFLSVGSGFIQWGITGFANSVGGRGWTFDNITTITPGAQQIARTTEGTTLNSRAGQVVDFRIANVAMAKATDNGFSILKGLNEGTPNQITSNTTLVKENLNTVVDTSGGDVTVTLEASPVEGQRHNIIHKITGGLLTIDGNGNDVYDNTGASSTKTYGVYFAVSLLFDGSDWLIK